MATRPSGVTDADPTVTLDLPRFTGRTNKLDGLKATSSLLLVSGVYLFWQSSLLPVRPRNHRVEQFFNFTLGHYFLLVVFKVVE